jgi:glutamate carboxypeptidase
MGGLSRIEAAAVERCESEPMLDQVTAWAAVNSGTRNLAGLQMIASLLADAFAELPGAVSLQEAAPVDVMDSDGTLSPLAHGRNLTVKVRPEAPVQLLFTGHMDTVFGADHDFQKVFWRETGILGGPGVADMKSGIAILLAALKAVEGAGISGLGYEVVINSDEETGSLGSAGLIADAARGKRAALTYEPSALPDGTLAGARPGSGNFSLFVKGRSAHAGRNPEDGRNAILAAADLALRLADAKSGGLSVNPARVDGGGPNNVVPDKAVLRLNLRPRSDVDQMRAQQILEREIAAVSSAHDVSIRMHGHFARPPKPIDGSAAKLFELVKRSGADLGQAIGWRDTGGVCDGNNIAAYGVPVVDTMGARGGAIHSDQEFLIVESLVERARLSALTIARLAAGEGL